MGYHSLLQGIFLTQGLNPGLLRVLHLFPGGFFTTEPLGQLLGHQYCQPLCSAPSVSSMRHKSSIPFTGALKQCPSAGQVSCRSWDRTHACLTQACSLLTPVPGITEGLHQPELPRDNQDGNPSHYCDGCKYFSEWVSNTVNRFSRLPLFLQ